MSAELETERLKDVVRDVGERVVAQLERIANSLDDLVDVAGHVAEPGTQAGDD